MSLGWDLFVLGLERDRLEVERVGSSKPRAVLLRQVLGESFSTASHRQMVARHDFEREAFNRPPIFDVKLSAESWSWFEGQVEMVRLAAGLSRANAQEEPKVANKTAKKPSRVNVSRVAVEPRFTEAQLRIAQAVAENATAAKWIILSKKREETA